MPTRSGSTSTNHADLLPRGAPGLDKRSERELRQVRTHAGAEPLALITEWMAVAMPDIGG